MCGSQPPEVRPVASRARPSATSSCCRGRMDASAKRQIPSVETRWNPRVPDPSAASPGGTFGVRAVHWSLHCLPSVKHRPFSGHCLPPSQPSCPRCRPGAPSSDPRSPWGPSTTPTSLPGPVPASSLLERVPGGSWRGGCGGSWGPGGSPHLLPAGRASRSPGRGCHPRLRQPGGLKRQTCTLSNPGGSRPGTGGPAGLRPSRGRREPLVLASSSTWWLQMSLGLRPHPSSLCLFLLLLPFRPLRGHSPG